LDVFDPVQNIADFPVLVTYEDAEGRQRGIELPLRLTGADAFNPKE
jgi:hypothetical protein